MLAAALERRQSLSPPQSPSFPSLAARAAMANTEATATGGGSPGSVSIPAFGKTFLCNTSGSFNSDDGIGGIGIGGGGVVFSPSDECHVRVQQALEACRTALQENAKALSSSPSPSL